MPPTASSRKSTLSLQEAFTTSVICFGLFTVWSTQAVLAGFPQARFSDSDSGNAWMVVVEVILAASALLYLHLRNFDTASLYPQPSVGGALSGIGIFLASWVVGWITIAVAVHMVPARELATDFSFSGVSLASIIVLAMVNGAFEEIFLLGVLVRGLRGYGFSIAVGLPLLVRILYHLYQGPLGALWVAAVGLTFTLFYLRGGKLWPLVLAHTLWDIVPVVFSGR